MTIKTKKLLAFSGSIRKNSFNKKLINSAVSFSKSETEILLIDLSDYPLPIYNGDIEEKGIPENAKKLRSLMIEYDGFIISSPEYNSSISPLLKNTIDWVSRPDKEVKGLAAYKHKSALLLSGSPGKLGGLRGLYTLSSILQNIGVLIFPERLALTLQDSDFDKEGKLTNQNYISSLSCAVNNYLFFVEGFDKSHLPC